MASNFDPVGFGRQDADPDKIAHSLEDVSTTVGELNTVMFDAIGNALQKVAESEGEITQEILLSIADKLNQINDVNQELSTQLTKSISFEVGKAAEVDGQLDSMVRIAGLEQIPTESGDAGNDIPIGIPPGAGEPIPIPDEPPPPTDGNGNGGADGEPDNGIAVPVPPDDGDNGGIPPVNDFPLPIPPPPDVPPPSPVPDPFPPPDNGTDGGDDGVPDDGCPVGQHRDQFGNCVPDRQPPQQCPAGQHLNEFGFCVPDQPVTTPIPPHCCPPPPAPTINIPPCPDVTVIPPQEEQPDTPSLPLPVASVPTPDRKFCNIDTYDTGVEIDVVPSGIGQAHPIIDFFYGSGFNLDQWIIDNDARANRGFNPVNRGIGWLRSVGGRFVKRYDQVVTAVANSSGCQSPIFIGTIIWRGVLSAVGILFSGAVVKLDQILKYRGDAFCPVEFPDENEATEAFVRGRIDEKTYKLWVEQNNHCWEPWKKMTDSRMNRVEPLMALQMWKRGFIDDTEFANQIRKGGYTEESLTKAFKDLGIFIPPITDLIRFMVRDVEDEAINTKFGLEDEFPEKWLGKTREWGEQQGIQPEVALNYWKAHWRIPSPTQLYEMFHRTRHLPDGDKLKTTLADVETALKQDDVLPFWVPKLINAAFRRPSERNVRRAFEVGAMTEEDVRINFQKLGLEDDIIEDLIRWANINKTKVILNTPEMRLFRDGLISEGEVGSILRDTLLPPGDINKLIRIAKLQGNKRFITRCETALRRRFLTGEIEEGTVRAELINIGVPIERLDKIIQSYDCEKRALGKQPPTSMLCTWLEQGSIGSQEFVTRLERVGWTNDDAMRILVSCTRKINEKIAREAKRMADAEKRALEKEQREMDAERRKLAASQKTAARQREKAERAKRNRDKLIQRTIARFSEQAELDVDTAGACVLGVERTLAADTLLTIDERIQTVVLAVEKTKPKTCNELKVAADALANQLLEFGEITEEFLESLSVSS